MWTYEPGGHGKRQSKHRIRHVRNVGIVRQEFKTTVVNTLKTLMDNVESMQEQVGNVNRDKKKKG